MIKTIFMALLCLITFTAKGQFSEFSIMVGPYVTSKTLYTTRVVSTGFVAGITVMPKIQPRVQAGWQIGAKFKMATIAITDTSSVTVTHQQWERSMHPEWEVWVGPSIRYGAFTAGASLTTAGRLMLTASVNRLTVGYFFPAGSRVGTAMLGYRQSF